MTPRWDDALIAHENDALDLVKAAAAAALARDRPSIVFIGGSGFDPRLNIAVERVLGAVDASRLTLFALDLGPGQPTKRMIELGETNRRVSVSLCERHGAKREIIPFPTNLSEKNYLGRTFTRTLRKQLESSKPGVVIIDVSGLPSSVAFPIVRGFLELADKEAFELVVAVCDNPDIDRAIIEEGPGDPFILEGMTKFSIDRKHEFLVVWAPVLGENKRPALVQVHGALDPREICPVLPFPARDPRRADAILTEYRSLLDETFNVDVRNFIYADERDPVDLYRALCGLEERYRGALKLKKTPPIVVLSSHSSKTLSIGVLLAALDRSLPVISAPPTNYRLDDDIDLAAAAAGNRLSCLWLAGDPYRVES